MMPTILASKVEYVASGYSRFDIILIFMYLNNSILLAPLYFHFSGSNPE